MAACVPAGRDRAWVSGQIARRLQSGLRLESRSTAPALPRGVALGDGLTEDEAVALALWNSPTFQADLAQLGVARADLAEAGMLPNPTLTLLFPLGPKQLEFTVLWPIEALVHRPRRVAAAERELERVAHGLVQSGLDLARDTRVAYVDAVLARDRVRLRADAERLFREIATIAAARFRAGEISEMEASAVHIEALTTGELAARQPIEAAMARSRLRVLLGLGTDGPATDLAPDDGEPAERGPLDGLVRAALASRPDLRAAEMAVEAAGARVGWERSRVFSLIAIADANGQGSQGFELGPGLQTAIPIFNQNQGAIGRAEADVQRAIWRYAAVRQQIVLDVTQAHAQLAQARAALRTWRADILPSLAVNVQSATSAFRQGSESYLVVLEATRRLQDARLREAEVLADARRAAAQLDRGVGRRMRAPGR